MNEVFKQIAAQQDWKIISITAVSGGDINQAFCVTTVEGKYFIKLNAANPYLQLFQKEARGLIVLQQHFLLKVPTVIDAGEIENVQYLVLEWLEPADSDKHNWQEFGRALAELHKVTQTSFGWHEESYIASIVQTNDWHQSWPAFYREQRIMPLVKMLQLRNVFTEKEIRQAEKFCSRLETMLPEEPPALLHGDLWSGNVMAVSINDDITTAIYDPDVFYGHREIDLAMTKLFGGFPTEFYDAYNEIYPLQNGWQKRLPLFQLYPLLVHAVLFGGAYIGRVREVIRACSTFSTQVIIELLSYKVF